MASLHNILKLRLRLIYLNLIYHLQAKVASGASIRIAKPNWLIKVIVRDVNAEVNAFEHHMVCLDLHPLHQVNCRVTIHHCMIFYCNQLLAHQIIIRTSNNSGTVAEVVALARYRFGRNKKAFCNWWMEIVDAEIWSNFQCFNW